MLPCFQVISGIIVKLSCCTTIIQINGQALTTGRSLKWVSLALTFQAAEITQIPLDALQVCINLRSQISDAGGH